jgi:putative oxidoreductase
MLKSFLTPADDSNLTSFGLLILRLWFGLTMFINHGLEKLQHFNDLAGHFQDPLGIGAKTSFTLVVFAEVVGALLITIGLLTRFAALVLVIDMGVAFFMVHKSALSGAHSGELASLYLAAYIVILFAGAGAFSADKAAFSHQSKSTAKH